MIYFTSDTHFGHKNILKYCNRPFTSVDEMDEELIKRWNATVKPTDTVYHIGDFSFHSPEKTNEILSSLNGEKILIWGNHDKEIKRDEKLRSHFKRTHDYYELHVQDSSHPRGRQMIILCHYPLLTWNKGHHGSWMIHGHCHGTMKYPFNTKLLDAGADVHEYLPISYLQVKKLMENKEFIPVDHHQ